MRTKPENPMSQELRDIEAARRSVKTKLGTIAAKIKATTCLHDLLRALVEFETTVKIDPANAEFSTEDLLTYHKVDLAQLPTFGTRAAPRNTDSCWSWDDDRLLVGEGPFKDWEIFDRDDESQAWRL